MFPTAATAALSASGVHPYRFDHSRTEYNSVTLILGTAGIRGDFTSDRKGREWGSVMSFANVHVVALKRWVESGIEAAAAAWRRSPLQLQPAAS
jgi:hypothetical protein